MIKKVSISNGNSKMGAIPSVSLPAIITCNPSAPCARPGSPCYALKLARLYSRTRDAYQNNLDILEEDPASYWLQVKAAAMVTRYFRYHVSGDLPSAAYFNNMVDLARDLPCTTFLAFTKQYQIVNDYLSAGGVIPSNLIIIFSNWNSWKCENPHGLPVCEVIFKDQQPAPDWKTCGGNCTECACRGIGCWELKRGETIAIYKH